MKTEKMIQWLTEQITRQKQREIHLRMEQREDEAVFCKIAGNVYDIFRTVLEAGGKRNSRPEAQEEFFEKKLEAISAPWCRAQEQASCHGDAGRVYIETLKLDAAAEVRQHWEGLK